MILLKYVKYELRIFVLIGILEKIQHAAELMIEHSKLQTVNFIS